MTEPKRLQNLDRSQREMLRRLNAAATVLAEQDYQSADEPGHLILVTGTPRSGTTFLTQALANCYRVSYISNIAAPFWQAPSVGVRFAELVGGESMRPASFLSLGGRTREPSNVHEFGYFWADIFGMPTMREADKETGTDWGKLRRTVQAIGAVQGRPVVMKSFHVALSIREALAECQNVLLVVAEREVAQSASSLERVKKELGMSSAGIIAEGVPDSANERVQIGALKSRIDDSLADLSPSLGERVLRVEHRRLRDDRTGVLKEVGDRYAAVFGRSLDSWDTWDCG